MLGKDATASESIRLAAPPSPADWCSAASATLELAANNYITCRVNPMDLKNRLCDVETDCRNRLHV
jgi:hypothetical protein